MANENKAAVVAAIWNNPEPAFNCRFRPSGHYLINERNEEYSEQGKIRLTLTRSGENIVVFYNGSSREEKTDVFTHLERYVLNTAGFAETLKRLADIYGLSLRYSEDERQRLSRAAIAREVAPSLIESLRKNPTGAAGKYIPETRGLSRDAHFGELTADSLNRAKEHLRNRGISYTAEDFVALGLTEERARNGYNVVIPYYNNGNVMGFILRNTTNNPNAPKYLYSQNMGRYGYSDRLKIGKPTFVVEGQMDAIRLLQAYATDADAPNVLAMGGAKISDDIAALLKRHNIDVITYVPDVEYNEQGERKTDIITAAIRAFQGVQVEGEHVVKTLFVSELETPNGANLNNYKIDADTYGKENGTDVFIGCLASDRQNLARSKFVDDLAVDGLDNKLHIGSWNNGNEPPTVGTVGTLKTISAIGSGIYTSGRTFGNANRYATISRTGLYTRNTALRLRRWTRWTNGTGDATITTALNPHLLTWVKP